MIIADVIEILEHWAPPSLQESYDNSRLLCGNSQQKVSQMLVSLDCTEAVVIEAKEKGANLIVSHHPIIFSGLKSLTGQNYIERTLILAIKYDIAIYAIHTNLDNIHTGVNFMIAEKLKIDNPMILAPKSGLLNKLITYVPEANATQVQQALFDAGAGHIGNYDHCSFNSAGKGTYRGNDESNPHKGEIGEDHEESEMKIEVIIETASKNKVLSALLKSHPYEEVAYDLVPLENRHSNIGSGMVGDLASPIDFDEFAQKVASAFNSPCIKHTEPISDKIKTVAFCGGSGGFLLDHAKRAGADVFITSDFKYHEFFDHENKVVIFDIGHFESEQFTPNLIANYLADKNVTFAVLLSEVNTNPVHYFIRQ